MFSQNDLREVHMHRGPRRTWTGGSHGLYGYLLILEHTGIFLGVEQSTGGELVDLVASLREAGNLRLYHLLYRLTWNTLKLQWDKGKE